MPPATTLRGRRHAQDCFAGQQRRHDIESKNRTCLPQEYFIHRYLQRQRTARHHHCQVRT